MSTLELRHRNKILGLLFAVALFIFIAGDVAAGDASDASAGQASRGDAGANSAGIEELVALFDLVAAGRQDEANHALGGLFSAGFLRDVGSQNILRTVQRIADEHGSVQAVSATPEPHEYELLLANSMVLAVGLHLEKDTEEQGRIGGIQLGRPRTLDRLLQDRVRRFASVHWDTRVFVAPFGGDTLIEFDGRTEFEGSTGSELATADPQHNQNQSRNRRSAERSVVMYPGEDLEHLRLILRVVRAVVDGNLELSNVVRLNVSHMSEEGVLSEKAPGTPYTLYSLSEYLLFEKDETAQRHLEAALRAQRGAARTEIDWSYRSLYELLERSTVLGGRGYSPIDHLLHSFFFVEAAGADAAAVMLVPGRNGTTHYVAVSQHDPDQAPTPESLRRDLELLAVPLRLLP